MSINYNSLKWGKMILPLVVLVSLLAAVVAKADLHTLGNTGGSYDVRFNSGENGIERNSYTVSETFRLANSDWFFTSFILDPKNVTMVLQSVINNAAPNSPAIDLSGSFTGTAKWTGQIEVKSGDRVLFTMDPVVYTNEEVGGITYTDKPYIDSGAVEMSVSDEFRTSFTELTELGVNLGEDDLTGIKEITFDFILSNISFDNNEIRELGYSGIGNTWVGSIEGLVSMTYRTTGTPEPASLLIFGLGLAGAGLTAARKRRAKK